MKNSTKSSIPGQFDEIDNFADSEDWPTDEPFGDERTVVPAGYREGNEPPDLDLFKSDYEAICRAQLLHRPLTAEDIAARIQFRQKVEQECEEGQMYEYYVPLEHCGLDASTVAEVVRILRESAPEVRVFGRRAE